MKWNSKRFAATAALALSASLALAGCGGGSSSSTASPGGGSSSSSGGGDLTVTFIPKNLGNPYFDTSDNGGKKAVSEIGGQYSQVGPQQATPDGQVPFINTAAQQGTKAIVISADDPSAPCDALKQAMSPGTKVVTFDSDTNPECRNVFVNQATADGIAKVEVDMIAKQIGDSGEIAILSASANATNQNSWIALMKKDLAANHPNVKLDAVVYGNDDDQTSFDKTSALLQQYPNLKGIISPTTVGIAAAARYLSTSQYKGKVSLTGLGTPNQMRQFVKDGTVQQFALWNPEDLGYLAAYAASALADGTISGPGDSFTAGKLGKYTVASDGSILLGKPFVFDKSNIDQFHF
jgi:rhamnose transport system substrate-binding protein